MEGGDSLQVKIVERPGGVQSGKAEAADVAVHRGHLKRARLKAKAVARVLARAIRDGLFLVTTRSDVSEVQLDQVNSSVQARLATVLSAIEGTLAVAFSGGVGSVTLATFAHRASEAFHAASPAVPEEATARVKWLAANQGWRLRIRGRARICR